MKWLEPLDEEDEKERAAKLNNDLENHIFLEQDGRDGEDEPAHHEEDVPDERSATHVPLHCAHGEI